MVKIIGDCELCPLRGWSSPARVILPESPAFWCSLPGLLIQEAVHFQVLPGLEFQGRYSGLLFGMAPASDPSQKKAAR